MSKFSLVFVHGNAFFEKNFVNSSNGIRYTVRKDLRVIQVEFILKLCLVLHKVYLNHIAKLLVRAHTTLGGIHTAKSYKAPCK